MVEFLVLIQERLEDLLEFTPLGGLRDLVGIEESEEWQGEMVRRRRLHPSPQGRRAG